LFHAYPLVAQLKFGLDFGESYQEPTQFMSRKYYESRPILYGVDLVDTFLRREHCLYRHKARFGQYPDRHGLFNHLDAVINIKPGFIMTV
jgi:hypothetical protein